MDRGLKRILWQHIGAFVDDERVIPRAGIEKDVWQALVLDRLRERDPQAWLVLSISSPQETIKNEINEYIRKSHAPAVANLRDLKKSMARAKRARTMHTLELEAGRHVTKRYIEFTPEEADMLAAQYERLGLANMRKAAQIRSDVKRARQLGLEDDQPFSKLVDEGWLDRDEVGGEEAAG